MQLHADFSRRILVHAEDLPWQPSPMAGVDRRPLDRIGGEVARATSLVRYAPGSRFSAHSHGGGEEFLVLDGVFSDEQGDFPAGCYVRNPPTSRHTPRSEPGTVIFVKLWQFEPADRTAVRVDINHLALVPHRDHPGLAVGPLFAAARENVAIWELAPGARVRRALAAGAELLVLAGAAVEAGDTLRRHSWLRLPPQAALDLEAGAEGARLWIKEGHLGHVEEQLQRLAAQAP